MRKTARHLSLRQTGVLLVLVPLLVDLAIVAALFFVQNNLQNKVSSERAARNTSMELTSALAIEQQSQIELFEYFLTGNDELLASSLNLAARARESVPAVAARLNPRDSKTYLAAEEEYLTMLKSASDRSRELRDSAEKRAGASEQLMRGLENVAEETSDITFQLNRKLGTLDNLDAEGALTGYLLAGGTLLNTVFAGIGALIFARSIVGRLRKVSANCDKVMQHEALEQPMGGGDELAQLDKALYQAAENLSVLNERRLTVTESSADVVFAVDEEGKIQTFSEAATARWGYSASFLEGRNFSQLIAGGDPAKFRLLLERSWNEPQVEEEMRIKHRSGEEIDIACSLRWNKEKNIGVGVAYDITEKKANQRLLSDREEQLRRLLESLPMGVLLVSNQGFVEAASLRARAMFSRSFVPNMAVSKFVGRPLPATWPDKVLPLEVLSMDSSVRHLEMVNTQIKFNLEQKFLLTADDVTERIEIERLKHRLLSTVSHDLRTPLSSMLAVIDMLSGGLYGALSERGAEEIQHTSGLVSGLVSLINDWLDIEKFDSGQMLMDWSEGKLPDIVSGALSSEEELSYDHGVILTSPEIVPAILPTDRHRLQQAITALLRTTIALSSADSNVIVRSRINGGFAEVLIGGSGLRLPPAELLKIFDVYWSCSAFDEVSVRQTRLCAPLAGRLLGALKCSVDIAQVGGIVGYLVKIPRSHHI